jgi:thiol:disulfide interchange protein DsbC
MSFSAKALLLLLAGLVAAFPALAAEKKPVKKAAETAAKAVQADQAETLGKILAERFPDLKVQSIRQVPYGGLYEVVTANQLFYTDSQAGFMIVGAIIETAGMRNVTEERMAEMLRVRFDLLPLDLAVKIVRGKGERRLAVFSDPDCPFCKRLEQDLIKVDNLTIYQFLFPLEEIHPQARAKARDLWCAEDRAKAWVDYWQNNVAPPAAKADCQYPHAQLAELGQALNVRGTPLLIFGDGRMISGAVPADRIEALLKDGVGK